MGVLTGLEPKEVFRYFEEICQIPHGSGNMEKISEYCVEFAKEHGLRYVRDAHNNVILFKDGTPGYEQAAPVIVQGHLDMVCEKTPECTIDFEKDGLSLRVEDGVVYAEGTTLGGDDGIAVAYGLALLASDTIPHPPLEVVFTTDEEIGMLGAAALDCSPLRSRLMLNLDSEEEGVLLVSCAGGMRADCHLPVERKEVRGVMATLRVTGLTGGHSGTMIDKGRANASRLLGRALNELGKVLPYHLLSVEGGLKENAIPREAEAALVVALEQKEALCDFVRRREQVYAAEYESQDPALSLSVSFGETGAYQAMDEDGWKRTVAALVDLPCGVMRMSADMPGLVQTSLNLGIVKTEQSEVTFGFSVRSSVGTEKEAVYDRIENLMDILGGTVIRSGDYPAWEYKKDSRLRELMAEVFEEQYGRKPSVEAMHAGVECGLFAGKLPGLDCVSFGPDMQDIHTPQERMQVASVKRTWEYLLEVLKRLS